MGIRFENARGKPQDPGRADHRAADISARAEDGVRPSPAQDAQAGRRSEHVTGHSAHEPEARSPGQPYDLKPVEVQPGLAGQALLDGVRPTGERDGRAAAPERLGDRERRPDVPGRSAGGDQEPRLWTLLHG